MVFGPIMRFTVGELQVELAPFSREDMGEFISLENGGGMNRFTVRKHTGGRNALTLEDEQEHYDRVRQSSDKWVWGIWVILMVSGVETRKLIGVTDLHGFDQGSTQLIQQATSGSLIFNKDYWGKGIARSAHKARTWFAFTQLGLHRINSQVMQENVASRKALERSGYTFVYTNRNEQYTDGRLQHLDHLECLNPMDLFWKQWWHGDRPTKKALEARTLTLEMLSWANENVELT